MKKIAVLGYGVVGSGVVELFYRNRAKIEKNTKTELDIAYILDLREFPDDPYGNRVVHDIQTILDDPEVGYVAECMGGVNPAYQFVRSCLEAGKSVATSNKQLVAEKGDILLQVAKEHHVNFFFEASVGGAIPIIRPLHTCLAANDISEVAGILNGTTNFILEKMFCDKMKFADALALAQKLGYAERDPSADVDGEDACRKICILSSLVFEKHVEGWDDPRMPTLCALRRRGYTPTSIFTFVKEAGISKADNLVDMRQLEAVLRAELELNAQRRVAVLEPVKLIIDNYPADQCEYFDLPNNPNRDANDTTTRKVAFTKELWIENSDFFEVPPPKFKRLTLGSEVRLMGAYLVRCTGVDKDENGKVVAIHAEADLETRNGNPADGRKVRGTIHWVSCAHCLDAEVELYDKLFTEANMNSIPDDADFKDYLNPDSVKVLQGAKLEESLKDAKPGDRFQFVRNGYFTPDSKHEGVYNRIVTLKDSFKL